MFQSHEVSQGIEQQDPVRSIHRALTTGDAVHAPINIEEDAVRTAYNTRYDNSRIKMQSTLSVLVERQLREQHGNPKKPLQKTGMIFQEKSQESSGRSIPVITRVGQAIRRTASLVTRR